MTLLGDITLTTQTTISSGKSIILELNGHTLSSNVTYTIYNSGTLTIQDSSADGSGKVENTNANGYAVYSNKSLTITGGTFTSTATT